MSNSTRSLEPAARGARAAWAGSAAQAAPGKVCAQISMAPHNRTVDTRACFIIAPS